MTWLIDIITNPFLLTPLASWFVAQLIKTVLYAFVHKKLEWERMFGDGGMPSGHSATVSSLAMFCALRFGGGSFEFAIASILAVVVCHDAMGVRRQAGQHAVVLNELLEFLHTLEKDDGRLPEEKLKEFLGHSPLQVVVGILIGILNAFLAHFIFFS
jgi:acid phosphatase family membrane protein YuiD